MRGKEAYLFCLRFTLEFRELPDTVNAPLTFVE